jgi:hypothetical protein
MKTIQQLLALLCIAFFSFSCGDDPIEEVLPTECYPTRIIEVVDDTTSLTLMELEYDAENRIKTAFIHQHFTEWTMVHKTEFTHAGPNKLMSATYTIENVTSHKTEYEYVYDGDRLTRINSVTIYPNFDINTQIYLLYSEDGYVDFINTVIDSTDYYSRSVSRDLHGNQTFWSGFGVSGGNTFGPGSNPSGEFTIEFDANHKGPFADLDYQMAVAYGFTTGSPIMVSKHALQRQIFAIILSGNGTNVIDRIFTNNKFNALDFQTEALDASGTGYIFEYDCQ